MSKGDLPGLASPQDSGDLPSGWGRVQKPKSQHLAPYGITPTFCQKWQFLPKQTLSFLVLLVSYTMYFM